MSDLELSEHAFAIQYNGDPLLAYGRWQPDLDRYGSDMNNMLMLLWLGEYRKGQTDRANIAFVTGYKDVDGVLSKNELIANAKRLPIYTDGQRVEMRDIIRVAIKGDGIWQNLWKPKVTADDANHPMKAFLA